MSKLIIIGIGLHDGRDISIKGLEALKKCNHIFAEFYTSKMADNTIEYLESQSKKQIKILTREQIEAGEIIIEHVRNECAKESGTDIAFLVPGDALTATTHIELLLMAKKENIDFSVINGPSIATVVPGLVGLQYYKFGRTTTLAYPEGDYFPESPYDVIKENKECGLHTLILLDIQANKERYMTANEGIELLLKINSKRKDDTFTPSTLVCVVARAGSENPIIECNKTEELLTTDFGAPMHSIVVPGQLHFKESEALIAFANAPQNLVT